MTLKFRKLRRTSGFAKVIEQREKQDGHYGIDDRGGGKMHGEPHAGLGQKNASRE
jgi:hypothetical protein